jgi:hypothetical protein
MFLNCQIFVPLKMGLKLCPFVDFLLGKKITTCVIDGYVSKFSSNMWLSQVNKHECHQAQWVVYMGEKKMFMYS